MITILSYLTSALMLSLWFYNREKKPWDTVFRNLFFASFALYFLDGLIGPESFSFRLSHMVRDIVLLSAAGLCFQWLVRFRQWFFIAITVVIASLTWYQARQGWTQRDSAVSDVALDSQGELLVELREGADASLLDAIADKYGVTYRRAFQPLDAAATDLDDYYVIDVPQDQESKIGKIKKAINRLKGVEWLEENEQINVAPLPAKQLPEINKRFGINDPGVTHLWGFDAMSVDQLYTELAKAKPAKKARIAILDTGVDAQHEDLRGNYTSVKTTYDNDPKGHGTHCAGIAGAVSNNGVGVASFSRDNNFVSISSIKVLNASGMGTQQTIIAGIIEAADNRVDVISLSLGGRSNQSRQKAYEKALKYANDKGVIVVAAAGNANRNANEFSPANTPGVICVSAIDSELNRAVFSNYVNNIDMGLAAPGVNIYSTIPGSKYEAYNGTSMATPYVAGLVGLMKSLKPSLTTKEAYRILRDTGKNTRNTKETGKLIQPGAAVKALVGG
ncbi:MAG: S8 family serine peptidase [Saprospiraceae bacterium]|nr:S8 family serine peptidase [Saprospiraceae bacterium]